jgi:hypothetical protein
MAKYTGIEPQGPDEFFHVPIYLYGVYGVYGVYRYIGT